MKEFNDYKVIQKRLDKQLYGIIEEHYNSSLLGDNEQDGIVYPPLMAVLHGHYDYPMITVFMATGKPDMSTVQVFKVGVEGDSQSVVYNEGRDNKDYPYDYDLGQGLIDEIQGFIS